ncbi:MAG: ankyrin repeat domain-containing protein [Candidatus Baltobacteraceae bacterium]
MQARQKVLCERREPASRLGSSRWTHAGRAGCYDGGQVEPRIISANLRAKSVESRLRPLAFVVLCITALLSQTACATGKRPQALLARAAAAGESNRVAQLVQGGADPSAMFEGRTSLLQWALLNRSATGLEALLDAGADPAHADETGDTVMHYASKADDPTYLDILLAHHVDPDMPNAITAATPLMDALLGDRDAQVAKLIAAGADLNRVDDMGNTALHVAAKINSPHVLDLLQAGADPLVRNGKNQTFQAYLALTPAQILSAQARDNRRQIAGWLRGHGIEPTFAL